MVLDALILGLIVVSFAGFVTAHVALAAKLLLHKPRWRGPVAFVLPALAPLWGWRAGLRGWAVAWLGALLLYALGRLLVWIVG